MEKYKCITIKYYYSNIRTVSYINFKRNNI